jgi:hypothetical protein
MEQETAIYKNSRLSKIFFVLSIFILAYWSIAQVTNVYKVAVVGAIYEIMWLFMLMGLFGLPVVSLIFLIRDKFSFRSLYLYTIIIGGLTIMLMFSI